MEFRPEDKVKEGPCFLCGVSAGYHWGGILSDAKGARPLAMIPDGTKTVFLASGYWGNRGRMCCNCGNIQVFGDPNDLRKSSPGNGIRK
jgi:hypothetical protein